MVIGYNILLSKEILKEIDINRFRSVEKSQSFDFHQLFLNQIDFNLICVDFWLMFFYMGNIDQSFFSSSFDIFC